MSNQPNQPGDDETQRFLQQLFHTMLVQRTRAAAATNEELVASLKGDARNPGPLTSEAVERALLAIPRGDFVPEDYQDEAYMDQPIRIARMGFNISAPHMYAMCLSHLDPKPGMSFLDIGSGCGHLTALAGYLVGPTGVAHGLEIRPDIIELSSRNLKRFCDRTGMDLRCVQFIERNCFVPDIEERTYDRIHVGACCPEAYRPKLYKMLKPNGILVTPSGDKLLKATKDEAGNVKEEELCSVRYGDLVIPSEAEIIEAERQIRRKRLTTIVIPPNPFTADMQRLVASADLSDVTIVVGGKPVPAHKTILSARSDYFRSLFYGGLRESRDNQIVLSDIGYDEFMAVLKYLYTGEVPNLTADTAIELLGPANYFKLDHLKAVCEETIRQSLDVENAAYVLGVAAMHEAVQLKRVTLDFILRFYKEVSATKTFKEMDRDLLLEVIDFSRKLAEENERK